MLFEFDTDQKLWQDTVREAVAKQCPPALVRSVAEEDADPTPLWKVYVDAGWTEMNHPGTAVELAIILEELGRACDPTPFLATMTQSPPPARTGRVGAGRYGAPRARRRSCRPVGRRDRRGSVHRRCGRGQRASNDG